MVLTAPRYVTTRSVLALNVASFLARDQAHSGIVESDGLIPTPHTTNLVMPLPAKLYASTPLKLVVLVMFFLNVTPSNSFATVCSAVYDNLGWRFWSTMPYFHVFCGNCALSAKSLNVHQITPLRFAAAPRTIVIVRQRACPFKPTPYRDELTPDSVTNNGTTGTPFLLINWRSTLAFARMPIPPTFCCQYGP